MNYMLIDRAIGEAKSELLLVHNKMSSLTKRQNYWYDRREQSRKRIEELLIELDEALRDEKTISENFNFGAEIYR